MGIKKGKVIHALHRMHYQTRDRICTMLLAPPLLNGALLKNVFVYCDHGLRHDVASDWTLK